MSGPAIEGAVRVSGSQIADDGKKQLAVVVGASSGIGKATAHRLGGDGYGVLCVGRDRDRLAATADEVGGRFQVCDVQVDDDVAALQATLERQGEGVAALVYTAGTYERAPVDGHDREMWDRTMAVNLRGAFAVTRAVLPCLRPGSHIVFLSSTAARTPAPTLGAYAASKAGLEIFAETLADELEPAGVHVHVVAPAATATPMQADGLSKFFLAPDHVAAAISWLLALPDEVVIRRLALRAPTSGPFAVPRR